jgi:hypothetical protein
MSEQEETEPVFHWSYRITQAIFTAAVVVCFAMFWYAGQLLGIPAERGHGGSLLGQPSIGGAVLGLIAAGVLLAGCTLFTHAFLRERWPMASLAAAMAGFSAWSMRGGPMQDVLNYAASGSVFIRLAFELILLGAIVGAVWFFIWREPAVQTPARPSEIVGAVLQHTAIMAVVVFLLAQADAKKQCVASVFLGGVIGASIVRANWPVAGAGKWFWVAPVLVGVIGYLLAAFQNGNWSTELHELNGLWAPLARPLPLDYASAGMFGSLLGYWMNTPEEGAEEPSSDEPAPATQS